MKAENLSMQAPNGVSIVSAPLPSRRSFVFSLEIPDIVMAELGNTPLGAEFGRLLEEMTTLLGSVEPRLGLLDSGNPKGESDG